jgi:hypothetical protein
MQKTPINETPINTTISKGDREDLQRLIRQREKVLKSAAKQRSAELLADFENQLGSQFTFDQDEIWEKAQTAADREVQKARQAVAARCRELGIPARFAPDLELRWYGRGENAVPKRRDELRDCRRSRPASGRAIGEPERSAATALPRASP